MATLFLLVKLLHIMSAAVWIGGVLTIPIRIAHIGREADPPLLAATARHGRFYGRAVIVPAAGVQLLTGLVMVFGFGFGLRLWVLWGMAAILVVVALTQTLLLPALDAVIAAAATATRGDPQLRRLQQRLVRVYVIILLVLLSTEWAMVFKPAW